jgi:hypothetical protein
MCGNGGGDGVARTLHELHGVPGGDVFEHHAQLRHVLQQRLQHALDEHRLAVEHIHRRIGHFAVHQERHAAALHCFERGISLAQVGDAGVGIGGRAGRI